MNHVVNAWIAIGVVVTCPGTVLAQTDKEEHVRFDSPGTEEESVEFNPITDANLPV